MRLHLEDLMLAASCSAWVGWLWYDSTPKTWPAALGLLVTTPIVFGVAYLLSRTRTKTERKMLALKNRYERQVQAFTWAKETFGEKSAEPIERAMRLLEEALELAQAEGVSEERVQKLAAHVFSKPPGKPEQEVGGVGCTLLAYAESIGVSAEAAELKELSRVLGIDKEVFRKRHNVKADAGVAVRAPE